MRTAWWKWEWDSTETGYGGTTITCDYLKRWRRGWVTLYKFETIFTDSVCVEWRLFLPFNINVGIEYDRRL